MNNVFQSPDLLDKVTPKTLILVVDVNAPGGVSNYYRLLKLDSHSNIKYFNINKGIPQSAFAVTLRLITKYCFFTYTVIRNRYKVVIVNPSLDLGKSFYRDMVFIIISNLLRRKTLVFFRGWFDPFEEKIRKSRLKLFLFRISYAKAFKYIVLGEVFKKKLLGLGVSDKTEFFIETTVADSEYLTEFDLNSKIDSFKDKIIFLFLSRIEKDKGIYIAIDAYAEFSSKYPERKSCLVIAGDGPDLNTVRKYVEDNNIPGIIFKGKVSNTGKKEVLFESHIMIFPSYTEGLPNCILEGMLYGMPIISRTTGGIPEVVHQNVNGFISDSFHSSVYADFLSTFASDNNLYRKISMENHQVALEKYTVEKVRERVFNILNKI